MNQQTKSQNIAQEMMMVANLKAFKDAMLDLIKLFKTAGYTKKETIKYMPYHAAVNRMYESESLFIYWIKKHWRKL